MLLDYNASLWTIDQMKHQPVSDANQHRNHQPNHESIVGQRHDDRITNNGIEINQFIAVLYG